MKLSVSFSLLLVLLINSIVVAQNAPKTYLFAEKDGAKLYLDLYEPVLTGESSLQSAPTMMFVFGGGFMKGSRDEATYLPWFRSLTERGYRVVSIDYRLGLKDKVLKFDLFHLFSTADKTKAATNMAVEDLFDATKFLIEKSAELSLDTTKIIVSGSSAGAITALTAEWEICNHTDRASVLPRGFNYAGVIAYSGAIMSDSGRPTYKSAPCPQLMFHGTNDDVVVYNRMKFGRRGMFGPNDLAKIYARNGFNYTIYRLDGRQHEVAVWMDILQEYEEAFLKANVLGGTKRVIDATIVEDSTFPAEMFSKSQMENWD